MRVVLSGYFGHGNTGDEAILAGMLATMRATTPDLEAVVISANPVETSRIHGVEAVPRMRPATILRALRGADGLVSGGGGLLQDRTSARPVAYYAGVMGLARLARRPYVIHAQGLGPIGRRPNRALAAMALRGATHVSLRDAGSIAFARAMGVRRAIDLVPDPAVVLRPTRSHDGPLVVAVRAWGRSAEHLIAIREALHILAADVPADRRIVALPMHEPVDRDPSAFVIEGIRGAAVVPAATSFDERVALIGSASLVLGMRLHALVLAAAAGTPGVAISYDPKVTAFASALSMPIAGDITAGISPRRIVEAALQASTTDDADQRATIDAMRERARASVATSLAALRDGANLRTA